MLLGEKRFDAEIPMIELSKRFFDRSLDVRKDDRYGLHKHREDIYFGFDATARQSYT